jgi:uncharacterized repeat protein (TIGR01451 family)
MSLSRLLWLIGSAAIILLISISIALSPVQIQLTLTPKVPEAQAGLPTTTPAPPTAIPPTAVPPTAAPPTEVPPNVAPTEPPRGQRSQPTPTAVPPTAIPVDPRSPQLTILKGVSPNQVKVGEQATFTLRIINLGDATASDVVVSDQVPEQLEIVDLRSSKGDIVVNGQRVVAYPRTLDPGEEQIFSIVVRVRDGVTDSQIDNLAIVTLGQPDDPGDNTSITTLLITPPDRSTQTVPPKLPRTADPTAMSVWAQYWPLLMLAFCIMGFGMATREGAFRQQQLQVTVGQVASLVATSSEERVTWEGHKTTIMLEPGDLISRWQAGASTTELVDLALRHNPATDRLAVSIAVQRVLNLHISKELSS